jgi:NTP pyrophosphatase (non-canonical NTP hydrolase)
MDKKSNKKFNSFFNTNSLKIYKFDFTKFQNNIYYSFFEKDKNRDYYVNVIWYLEELLEFILELFYIINSESNLELFSNNQELALNKLERLKLELSDVFAWIFSILNLNNIKINQVFIILGSSEYFNENNNENNLDFIFINLVYSNLYFIKSIKKQDLKNLKNAASLIIFYLIKISFILKTDLNEVFQRYKVCPKCNQKKCIC